MDRVLINFNKLIIGDRTFEIPVYQRNYSWTKQQWEDLWNDLISLKTGRTHYFGTFLLKRTKRIIRFTIKDFEVYEIIDGQQRMATTMILLRTIMSQLSKSSNPEIKSDIQAIEREYFKYQTAYKLELLGDDKDFFKNYIMDDNEDYISANPTFSQERLKSAKKFFKSKIKEIKSNNPAYLDDFLLELKRRVDHMEIIRYEVENSADAVLIFETVNDRGKPLTNLEKTKSFLMHTVCILDPEDVESYLETINVAFNNIFRVFEQIKTNSEVEHKLTEDTVQRYHSIIYSLGRRIRDTQNLNELKKKVSDLTKNNEEEECLRFVINYSRDLENTFLALKQIVTYSYQDNIKSLIEKIFLSRVANFLAILVAAWIKFGDEKNKLMSILSLIEIAQFRIYGIGKRRQDVGERFLYDLAYDLYQDNIDYKKLETELKKFINDYQDTKNFEINLRATNFYARVDLKDQKYLLYEYEEFLKKEARETIPSNLKYILSTDVQAEHIWSQSSAKLNLDDNQRKIHEKYKDKLGNLTLATQSWNASWGNSPFKIKKTQYQDSSFRVQRELASNDDWGQDQIDTRENKIIEFALLRWKI